MGDQALIEVAQSMNKSLKRADDYCFRLGGEEFGIIFKVDKPYQAKEFADNIRKNIQQLHIRHQASSTCEYITASVGLVCKKAHEFKGLKEAYHEADTLLYKAKLHGRNRVESNI